MYNLYPANGGNEGLMYLLSNQQFNFLNENISDELSKPLEITLWNKAFNSTHSEYQKHIGINYFHKENTKTLSLIHI